MKHHYLFMKAKGLFLAGIFLSHFCGAGVVANYTYDFEGLGSSKTFTANGIPFTLTGFMVGQSIANFGSGSPPSAGYMDTGFEMSRSNPLGGLKSSGGQKFTLNGLDVWPSKNAGGAVEAYGATINIKGYVGGILKYSVDVNTVTFNQTPNASGGNWHRLTLPSTESNTPIDEFSVSYAAGNYIAVDNFIFTLPSLPGAPTGVSAVAAGSGAASVSFAIPANNGNAAITSYTVTSSPGNITAVGSSSPIKLTGLTNNVSYTFTVTATNGVGTGTASAPSSSMTPVCPATNGSFSLSVCDSYTFNGITIVQSGAYKDTLSNMAGCDSIITLNLTILTVDTTVSLIGQSLVAQEEADSYQWVNATNYTPIVNATSASFTPNATGSYAVILLKGNCKDTSGTHAVRVLTTGWDNSNLASSFQFYPNPAAHTLNVRFTEEIQGTLSLLDSQGKEVANQSLAGQSARISISDFPNGLYVLRIVSGNSIVSRHLVIAK